MKKNDKKFEEKLSQDLEQYYNNIEIPELSLEKQEELKNLAKQNKSKGKRFSLWQRKRHSQDSMTSFLSS